MCYDYRFSRLVGSGLLPCAFCQNCWVMFRRWSGGCLPALERLEAVTDVENARSSQRVLEKAGFHKEGVLRRYIAGRSGGNSKDAVIYSFLSSDRT
jgi:hypothetical protein